MSESFQTLVDSKGLNRIVIDTDAEPWANSQVKYPRFDLGIFQGLPSDSWLPLVVTTTRYAMSAGEGVTGDETVNELWKKVTTIEKTIEMFLTVSSTFEPTFEAWYDVVSFVRRHTRGYVYRSASAIIDAARPIKVVSAPRGWKCTICCEKYHESHMCHSFSCGHLVHFSCKTGMMSSECPECRVFD